MNAHLPLFVRRRDGSPVPFDADCICQSLYEAGSSLGDANTFLARELTDIVVHFLAREDWPNVPTTVQIVEFVEKIVREAGQPGLARTYGDLQRDTECVTLRADVPLSVARSNRGDQLIANCFTAFGKDTIFSRDVSAALEDGMIRVLSPVAPAALTSLVLDTRQFAELPWWAEFTNWRDGGGACWIVDGPEWLCTGQMNPAFTSHLCERLLALPTFADRAIELHLNISEPPAWASPFPARPLFNSDDEVNAADRGRFLDSLLERWKALDATHAPTIAWHLDRAAFDDDLRRRRLIALLRQALHGRAVRFVFDRPDIAVALSEGLDRKTPGSIIDVAIDLTALIRTPHKRVDAAMFLQKLPSLARLAVSVVRQKQAYLKKHAKNTLLTSAFTIDRAVGVIAPLGLDHVVHALTGERLARSPLSLDFAERILRTLRTTLDAAARTANVELRINSPPALAGSDLSAADETLPIDQQLTIAGKLHAAAGGGTATLLLEADREPDWDALARHLAAAWDTTDVRRITLRRAVKDVRQAELAL